MVHAVHHAVHHDLLQVHQIEYKTGVWIDFTLHHHGQFKIMSVVGAVSTLAKNGVVLLVRPLGVEQLVGRAKRLGPLNVNHLG